MPSDRARSRYRAAVAVELRRGGAEYEEIAKELGFASKSGAWMAVNRSLKQRAHKAADVYLLQSLAELELLHERSWKRAMMGHTPSIRACLGVINARVRLLGLGSQQ